MYNFEDVKKEFLDICELGKYPKEEIKEFIRLINYSEKVLKNKNRLAGYPIVIHNIRIASWIAKNKLGIRTIKASLLYETCRHTDLKNIEEEFCEEITTILKETKRLSIITKKKKKEHHSNLSAMIIVSLKDVRVLFIKLAAKLENLYTIDALPRKQQLRIAKDVIEFYAPLAQRIGVEKIRRGFEDKAFQIINPKKYNEIYSYLDKNQKINEVFLNDVVKEVTTKLKKIKISSIKSRLKHIYSIYNKFKRESQNGSKKLTEQTDYYGIRIITKKESDCFKVAEILRDNYKVKEVKDYITNKKPNNYQSIHVICVINDKDVEFQIRTPEMEWVAEYGSASHKSYKGISTLNDIDKKIHWLRDLFEVQIDSRSSEMLKQMSFELFDENVFLFTPNNDIIKLPIGATILDFAFYVHDNLGLHCVGAIINNEFKSIKSLPKNGDMIKIITDKDLIPNQQWYHICKTKKAKTKLKKYFKGKLNNYCSVEKKDHDYTKIVQSKFGDKFELGSCCEPLPFDYITGVQKSKHIIVHKKNCFKSAIKKNIEVQWVEETKEIIALTINAKDRVGLLADLLEAMGENSIYISNVKGKVVSQSQAKCIFKIKPIKIEILAQIIKELKKVKGVTSIKL